MPIKFIERKDSFDFLYNKFIDIYANSSFESIKFSQIWAY